MNEKLDAIAKFDAILVDVMFLEAWAVFWLVPLGGSPPNVGLWRFRIGTSPDGIRRHRLGRFLIILLLLLVFVPLEMFMFFGPATNQSPGTTGYEYVVVALTPGYVVLVVSGAVAMVRAGRQRRQSLRALRQLHRQRQSMPS